MRLLRRPRPLVRAEVALYGPRRAAALLHPGDGRWPEHEARDRLTAGVGLAALAAFRMTELRWMPYRDALAALATRLARAEAGPLPGDLAQLDGLGQSGLLNLLRCRFAITRDRHAHRGTDVQDVAADGYGLADPIRI